MKKKRKEIHLSVLFLEQVCFYQGSRLISKFIRLINRIVKDGQDSTKRSLNRQIVRKEEKGIVHLKILKLDNSIMKIDKLIRTKRAVDLFASGRILSFGGDRIARILSRSFSRQRGNDH